MISHSGSAAKEGDTAAKQAKDSSSEVKSSMSHQVEAAAGQVKDTSSAGKSLEVEPDLLGSGAGISGRVAAEITARLTRQEENLIRSAVALADALQYVETDQEASPQVARSVQASENRWRAMDQEFGLLDSAEVAERQGASKTNRNLAHSLAKKGRIVGVRRGRRILYPGFQFDQETGQVRSAISRVAELGRASGWEDGHLLQWFLAPNGFLGGNRPVDAIDDQPTLLTAARADMTARW